MASLVEVRLLNRSTRVRVKNYLGTITHLSTDTPVIVDLDDPSVRVQLAHHSAIGQYIVQAPVSGAQAPVVKTANYTLTPADQVVFADATGGAFTLTIPTAVGATSIYWLSATTSSINLVTVDTTGGETVGGHASGALKLGTQASGALFDGVTIASDQTAWQIM